jgi:hypothetical protein
MVALGCGSPVEEPLQGIGGATSSIGGSVTSSAGTVAVLSSGGTTSGSPTTGGLSSGEVSSGGAATGGVNSGGVATGGVNSGGVATGGVNSGGVATGGAGKGGSTGGVGKGGSTGGAGKGGSNGGASGGALAGASNGGKGGRSSGGAAGAVATGGAATGGSAGASGCVQNLACKMTAPPSTGDIHQDCVDRINQFLTQCACLPPLTRRTDGEACADQMAEYDAAQNTAHAGVSANICQPGGSQNECPGYSSISQVIGLCMQQMWDEGPPPTSSCTGTCYETYGHYINMTDKSVTKVACGFYTTAAGKVWAVQNFSR